MTETEIVKIESDMRLGIIPARTPHDVIVQAAEIAKELAGIIKDRKLTVSIQGRNFVRVEGWSTMGAMLGVLPREVTEMTKRFEDGSYESTVELIRISDGAVIGRASALVGMDEKDSKGKPTWANRAEYARRSMAVTRATGKAYRLGFSWIIAMAGYETTPAEEMETIDGQYREAEQPTQSDPTPPATNGKNVDVYQAVIDAHLSENEYSAKNALKLCATGYDTPEKAIAWMRLYRGWRDTGADSKTAAAHANMGELP